VEELRKTTATARVFPFAKSQKSPVLAIVRQVVFDFKSIGYESFTRCMGCKGSSVRITPFRPFIASEMPVLRTGLFVPAAKPAQTSPSRLSSTL
jgi:hypothetical protein